MLRTRLLLAICIIVPLLALMWADYRWHPDRPGVWLFPVAVAMWFLAGAELRRMMASVAAVPPAGQYFASLLSVVAAPGIFLYWPLFGTPYPENCPLGFFGWPMIGLAAAVGISFLGEMARFTRATGRATTRLATSLLACCYLGIPLAFLVALRFHGGNAWGMTALLSLLVIVKMSDAGAYGTGRLWGRRKLAPQLSPNKTIEGAVGGIIVAILTAILFGWLAVPLLVTGESPQAGHVLRWGVLGGLLALAAMAGDLAESLLKRDLGCKDSSRWLPGLGGGLDLIDSVLWAAPVAYLAWIFGWIGPA